MDDKLLEGFEGRYLGDHDLIKTLKKDMYEFSFSKKTVKASRWTMLDVSEDLRSTINDREMQFH